MTALTADRDLSALRQSEAHLRAMFEQAAVGIVRAGLDGVILEVNGKLCEMVGRTREELVGTKLVGISHPDHAGEGIAMRRQIVEGSLNSASSEKRFIRADGTVFWARRTMSAVRDAAGAAQSIIHIIEDISDTKKAAEKILALNASLEQRSRELEMTNKELEAFSYSVSHDLRAPLRHILGFGEMLAEDPNSRLSEEGRRYLQVIRDASGEMAQLIDDLLSFSRMGRVEMVEADVDMALLVEQVRRGLETAAKGRNIRWTVAELPHVRGDMAMLRQVYANLIGNAIKYSRPRDPAEIEIGCNGARNGRLVFFVKDNGVGFDMKYASKLFGVFQRLHRAEEFEGSGVGLANVQRIIARHGGEVWAEAAPDKGATFYFTLNSWASQARAHKELAA